MSYRYLFRLLIHYKYQFLFPIAAIEGPIITVVSGMLISLGYLSILPTFLIVVAGDLVSDSLLYAVGRFGRNSFQRAKFIKNQEGRIKKLEYHFQEHPGKTFAVGKISYGLGFLFLIAAGASKMLYSKFMEYTTVLTAVKSSALLFIGYYFGRAALRFGRHYLPYYALAVIIFLPLGYLVITRMIRNKTVVSTGGLL